MSANSDAFFKCIGYFFRESVTKKKVLHHIYKHNVLHQLSFECSRRLVKKLKLPWSQRIQTPSSLIDEITVLEEVNGKRSPRMHRGSSDGWNDRRWSSFPFLPSLRFQPPLACKSERP